MKSLITLFLLIVLFSVTNEVNAQSLTSEVTLDTDFNFSEKVGFVPETTVSTLHLKKKTSKLLTLADFTLEPKSVFLCCTKNGYGFYFKF